MLEKHVVDALGVVCETTHDIRLVLDYENVVVVCAELLEVCRLIHFFLLGFSTFLCERFQYTPSVETIQKRGTETKTETVPQCLLEK